jgi:hypothetical protein
MLWRDRALLPFFEGRISLDYEGQSDPFGFHPLHRWELKTEGHASRTILLAGYRMDPVPGTTSLRFGVLDGAGKVLSVTDFTTGWRTYLSRARLATVPFLVQPVLAMETERIYGRSTTIVQYYVLLEDAPVLVRLEDKDGTIVRNSYSDSHGVCGPPFPKRNRDEWLEALSSGDSRTILVALMWLGGTRRRENREVNGLRQDPSVRAMLTKLSVSENSWIAEGARLALD